MPQQTVGWQNNLPAGMGYAGAQAGSQAPPPLHNGQMPVWDPNMQAGRSFGAPNAYSGQTSAPQYIHPPTGYPGNSSFGRPPNISSSSSSSSIGQPPVYYSR